MIQTLWSLIEFIFWLILLFTFFYSSLTYALLWMHVRLSSPKNEANTSFAWQSVIKSFSIEFFCAFATCLLYPLRPWSLTAPSPTKDNSHIPVLLVHGYLQHQNAWIWFNRALRKKEGIGPIYTMNLASPFASIAKLAEQVQHKVHEILTETHAKQIILIGHSMGGLVSGYFCEHLAQPNQVAAVITLGTAFQGTQTAVFAYGENGEEMLPDSPFLKKLVDKIHQSKVPYFSIASKADNIIIPWYSALLTDQSSTKTVILNHGGHLGLLIAPAVVDQVANWIISSTT